MSKRIATLISGLSSPYLVISEFALWVIAAESRSFADFVRLSLPLLLTVILLPFGWIYVGMRRGRFTDMHVMVREQRAEPFVVATTGAAILVASYILMRAPHPLVVLATNLLVNGVLFGLMTHYYKVSMHAAAFSASVLIVSLIIDHRLIALLALLPAIVWARVQRRRHSVPQALVATVVVLAATWITCRLMGIAP